MIFVKQPLARGKGLLFCLFLTDVFEDGDIGSPFLILHCLYILFGKPEMIHEEQVIILNWIPFDRAIRFVYKVRKVPFFLAISSST